MLVMDDEAAVLDDLDAGWLSPHPCMVMSVCVTFVLRSLSSSTFVSVLHGSSIDYHDQSVSGCVCVFSDRIFDYHLSSGLRCWMLTVSQACGA